MSRYEKNQLLKRIDDETTAHEIEDAFDDYEREVSGLRDQLHDAQRETENASEEAAELGSEISGLKDYIADLERQINETKQA